MLYDRKREGMLNDKVDVTAVEMAILVTMGYMIEISTWTDCSAALKARDEPRLKLGICRRPDLEWMQLFHISVPPKPDIYSCYIAHRQYIKVRYHKEDRFILLQKHIVSGTGPASLSCIVI